MPLIVNYICTTHTSLTFLEDDWFGFIENLFKSMPEDLDPDRDDSAERQQALHALRCHIAVKWREVSSMPGGKSRSEIVTELEEFLKIMHQNYGSVQICPQPLGLEDEGGEGDECQSTTSIGTPASVSSSNASSKLCEFDWLFLNMSGDVWGVMKAILRAMGLCVGPNSLTSLNFNKQVCDNKEYFSSSLPWHR